eukprot:CAMPEP_0117085040 /NCGR_PEP_ID=MMETSP0472-20121206/59820_1 /TAXON_ID=693140 ORGANISM="Tiarina fusus, Strain LIS" /NCGR_SAMPLE_ID=MMETSP0472 /ASSEMBLY_ACC=CAM_ASM_000603 /LENGTH=403 /DNA_ID=CAMNT_0004814211 /DNA_START=179 /DNA_END=1391 /DNA_ORIENTATION=-
MSSITLRVKSGSRFETEENNGANNLLQHLAFTGKSNHGPTVAEAFEKFGAVVEFHPHEKMENSDVTSAIEILGEMVNGLSNLSGEQIEAVRPRVIRHKEAVSNCKYSRSMDHLHSIIYQQDTLGLTREGSLTNLQSLDAKTLSNFASKNYSNSGMTLGVAGNLNPSEVWDAACAAFPLEKSHSEFVEPPTAKYYGSIVTDRDDSNDDVIFTVGYEGVSISDPKMYPIMVVKELIGDFSKYSGAANNHSGRLAEFVATEGICDSFNCFNQMYTDCGVFGVTLVSQGKHLDTLVGSTVSEFVRLAHNARPAEVERAKVKLQNKILAAHNGPDTLSKHGAFYSSNGAFPPTLNDMMNDISNVSLDDIRETCGEYFTDTEPAVVAIGSTRRAPDYNQVRGWTHWWRI